MIARRNQLVCTVTFSRDETPASEEASSPITRRPNNNKPDTTTSVQFHTLRPTHNPIPESLTHMASYPHALTPSPHILIHLPHMLIHSHLHLISLYTLTLTSHIHTLPPSPHILIQSHPHFIDSSHIFILTSYSHTQPHTLTAIPHLLLTSHPHIYLTHSQPNTLANSYPHTHDLIPSSYTHTFTSYPHTHTFTTSNSPHILIYSQPHIPKGKTSSSYTPHIFICNLYPHAHNLISSYTHILILPSPSRSTP